MKAFSILPIVLVALLVGAFLYIGSSDVQVAQEAVTYSVAVDK